MLVLVVHLNMALRAIFEIVLLVSTFQLPLNRPCMHCRVGTAVGTLVEVVTFLNVVTLDETLLELLSVETETLVPSEPQQGMQHQGTRRDGELFPVASGRTHRLAPKGKVVRCPSEDACFLLEGKLSICPFVDSVFQLCMAQVVGHTLQQPWLARLVPMYHSHDVVVF